MNTMIVGAGRIGLTLAKIADSPILITRKDPIPQVDGPIIVCTRNDDLEEVVQKTPVSKRGDLVFVQNGMVHSWLASHGLENNTQSLLYFAVSSRGALPVDGGKTVVWGKWSEHLITLLAKGDLACTQVDKTAYQHSSLEKYLWICVFGVICQRFGCTVSQAVHSHRTEIADLANELALIAELVF